MLENLPISEKSCQLMGSTFFGFVVFRETDGDGVGRILEASGNADLLNNCFKLLRC